MILWSRQLSVYTVPFDDAMRAYEAICPVEGGRYDAVAFKYYSGLFGWRYPVANAGAALLAGAITVIAGLFLLASRASPSVGTPFRTPTHRWQFLVLGIFAIFLLWIASMRGLETDLDRLHYPICADSIGIPMFGLTVALVLLTPILVISGFLITRGFGILPAKLSQWDSSRPRRSWIVTAIFLTLTFLNVSMLAIDIGSSDIVLPAGVLTTYLLLATRAALLAPSRAVQIGWDE